MEKNLPSTNENSRPIEWDIAGSRRFVSLVNQEFNTDFPVDKSDNPDKSEVGLVVEALLGLYVYHIELADDSAKRQKRSHIFESAITLLSTNNSSQTNEFKADEQRDKKLAKVVKGIGVPLRLVQSGVDLDLAIDGGRVIGAGELKGNVAPNGLSPKRKPRPSEESYERLRRFRQNQLRPHRSSHN